MSGLVSLGEFANPRVKAVIYGRPGVGKTVFAGTSQSMRTFIIDIDHGAESIPAYLVKNNRRRDLVYGWRVEKHSDFDEAMKFLLANIGRFDLAVVDSATELARLVVAEAKTRAKHIYADQRDWGFLLDAMEAYARFFRTLPLHVIWTGHELEYTDEDTKRLCYRPSFQGAFAREFGKHFGLIARFRAIDAQQKVGDQVQYVTHRLLQAVPDQVTVAKDRSGALAVLEMPDIDAMFHKYISAIMVTPAKGEPDA